MGNFQKKFILANLGQRQLAVPLTDGSDFFPIKSITPLPNADSKIIGLTYHQGHVVVVLALGRFLNMDFDLKSEYCLLTDWQGDHYGLLVDSVGDILTSARIVNDRKNQNQFIIHRQTKIPILDLEKILKQLI